jgi:hypothetical protein
MNLFYKSHAIDEWNQVREKIPQHLGLFGTIFTTLACNGPAWLDPPSPHT